jgi:histidinol-phosphate/aromatic aminotransferase/cobyric acid decarboxylase-like protein
MLKQQEIHVRYFNQPWLQDKLSITVGTAEENEELIRCWVKLLHLHELVRLHNIVFE